MDRTMPRVSPRSGALTLGTAPKSGSRGRTCFKDVDPYVLHHAQVSDSNPLIQVIYITELLADFCYVHDRRGPSSPVRPCNPRIHAYKHPRPVMKTTAHFLHCDPLPEETKP